MSLTLTSAYEILTGVGYLYIAPVGESFPDVNTTPAGNWSCLGETEGGVKVTPSQSIEKLRVDQETGPVKAVRHEEDLKIETSLAVFTLETIADVLGNTVTDIAPGSGTIGTRKVGLHSGGTVDEYSLLFRGKSPYGDYPAQYEVPRGIFDMDEISMEYKKDDKTLIPIAFSALVDLDASSEDERFGRLVGQDAAALA